MKVDKKTTMVGFAEALSQTLDIVAKKMNEQQNQINAAHILIDNLQRDLDELKNPTLFDKQFSMGLKDGWAYHKVKEKFGVFPRSLTPMPVPPTQDTLNWIKSRAIAYRKKQEKMDQTIENARRYR